jgi:hypothetical protein
VRWYRNNDISSIIIKDHTWRYIPRIETEIDERNHLSHRELPLSQDSKSSPINLACIAGLPLIPKTE